MKKRPSVHRRLPAWSWLLLVPATASATLSPTINALERPISEETATSGAFISLADLQEIVTARGDLKTAAVLTGEGADGTSATTLAEELANEGDEAAFTLSGPDRYSRNDAAVALAATSGGRFGLVNGSNTWSLGSKLPQGVSHFGAIFYGYLADKSANLVSVRAHFTDGTSALHTATAAEKEYVFVGFAAPPNTSILSIQVIEAPGGGWLGYDDVTIVLAEPGEAVSVWDGDGTDNLWSTAGNWQSDVAPAAGHLLSFGATEKAEHVNDFPAGTAFNGIQFTAGAPGHLLTGNAIVPGSSVINGSGQLQIVGVPLQLEADLLVSATGGIEFDSAVSGDFSITKAGASPVRFHGENSFKGALHVNQGAVEITGGQSEADGGFTISNVVSSSLTIGFDAIAAVAEGREIRLGIHESVGTGAAVLNIQGELTSAGTLSVLRGSTVNVTGELTQTGPAEIEGVGGYGATLNINSGGTATFGGTSPVLFRSGTNDAGRGRINVNGGTLITSTGFAYDSDSTLTARLTVSSGGTVSISGPVEELVTGIELFLGPGGGIFDTAGHDTAISVPIGGAGAFVKDGPGRLTLASTNTFEGDTFVDRGVLATGTTSAFHDAFLVEVAEGASLHLGSEGIEIVAGLTLGSETLPHGTYDATTHPSFLTGSGKIRVADADPYLDWIASFPSLATDDDRDKDADPDGDGLANFVEFALASNPSDPSDRGVIVTDVTAVDGGTYLTLTLPVRDGATFSGPGDLESQPLDGVIYAIQGSEDLADFTTADVVEVTPALSSGLAAPPTGWSYRTFRLSTPVSGGPRGFLRAGFSPNP